MKTRALASGAYRLIKNSLLQELVGRHPAPWIGESEGSSKPGKDMGPYYVLDPALGVL